MDEETYIKAVELLEKLKKEIYEAERLIEEAKNNE